MHAGQSIAYSPNGECMQTLKLKCYCIATVAPKRTVTPTLSTRNVRLDSPPEHTCHIQIWLAAAAER